MAQRKSNYEKAAAKAAMYGLSVEEYRRKSRAGRLAAQQNKWFRRHPKTYAEIKRENRARRIKDGWRGQPVLGGGPARHNDAYLAVHEINLMP